VDLVVAGFQVAALVVVISGVSKVAAPTAFRITLNSLGLPAGSAVARVCGIAEVAVGGAALWFGGRVGSLVVAGLYAIFCTVVVAARRSGVASCGCFGSVEAPPSMLHVIVNALSGGVALLSSVIPPDRLVDVLGAQPLAGLPYLALLASAATLVVVIDTTGAQVVAEVQAVRSLRPVFVENNVRGSGSPARRLPRSRTGRV
jgi:hypothetical protein